MAGNALIEYDEKDLPALEKRRTMKPAKKGTNIGLDMKRGISELP